MLQSAINLAAMGDFHNDNEKSVILDLVKNPIVPGAKPPKAVALSLQGY
jgi:hypothetical protein